MSFFKRIIRFALVVLTENIVKRPQTMINISIGGTPPHPSSMRCFHGLQAVPTTLFSKFNKINDRKLVKTSIGLFGLRITECREERFLFTLLITLISDM